MIVRDDGGSHVSPEWDNALLIATGDVSGISALCCLTPKLGKKDSFGKSNQNTLLTRHDYTKFGILTYLEWQ